MLNRFLGSLCALVLIMTVLAPASRGADTTGVVAFLESVDVGLYLDTGYEFNFNQPQSGENSFRSLDPDDNEFEIHMLELTFERTPTGGSTVADHVGFRADLVFGEDAERIHSAGLGDDTDAFDLLQAYINVLAPVGEGLNIYAGKFTTLAGFELIESKDNPNITRSFLFGLAIPFTHTGIRASYSTGPLGLTFGLNNGWDVTDDNNDGKTFEAQVSFEQEMYSVYVTGYFGPEQDSVDGDWRELITIVGSVTPMEGLTFTADLDFGWEQDAIVAGVEDDAFWWGIAGYVTYDVNEMVSLALRGEYFDDSDGTRTGIDQSLWEITPTIAVRPFPNHGALDDLVLRLEYRHDQSNEDAFEDSDGTLKDTQDTIALQLYYTFSM